MSANQPKAGHCEICGGLAHANSPFTTIKDGKFYHKLCLNYGNEPLKWKFGRSQPLPIALPKWSDYSR